MLAGLIGVPLGSILAQKLRVCWHQADPLLCAAGLLLSAPMIFFAIITASSNSIACFVLIFFGQLALNLNWSIVADILLVNIIINSFHWNSIIKISIFFLLSQISEKQKTLRPK